jgi:hypothetical protein
VFKCSNGLKVVEQHTKACLPSTLPNVLFTTFCSAHFYPTQNLSAINNSTSSIPGPVESIPTNNSGSSSSTLEIFLAILPLLLGLAAVAIAILQFRQGRAAKAAKRLQETHRQFGQPDVELPDYSSHVLDIDPGDSN